MANNRFDFLGHFVDPNSIFIRNHYVYFKHTNPKPIIKQTEDNRAKVQEITPAEQAKQIAESKEEIATGKRKLPEDIVIDKPAEIKKKRKREVAVYEPDALD